DVVDHQVVNMLFEDEVTVNFTMTGCTAYNTRHIKIMGTCGEIVGDQGKNTVVYTPFGEKEVVYDINKLATDLSGHGGGDNEMLTTFFSFLRDGGEEVSSTIASSIQSHVMAFAAEESRLNGGKLINIDEFADRNK
ncbi:MAG: gfo/Idh/MocA family oxidoreductase, partial [Clostridia bacterium]|nr:gfo/Idh/MocA family oxidoreductase [Clostridia bacterium]